MKLNLSEKKDFHRITTQSSHIVVKYAVFVPERIGKKSDNHTRSKYVANHTDTDTRLTRMN